MVIWRRTNTTRFGEEARHGYKFDTRWCFLAVLSASLSGRQRIIILLLFTKFFKLIENEGNCSSPSWSMWKSNWCQGMFVLPKVFTKVF